jgi:hypothetical protein
MINITQLPAPQVLVALPEQRDPNRFSTPPPLFSYFYNAFFASRNTGAPKLLNAVDEGLWHEGSEIEVLLLPISYETWCEMTTWIRNRFGNAAALATQIRVYGERHQLRTHKGSQYLVVTSSRFESISKVQAFAAYCWGNADIYGLVINTPPAPVEEKKQATLPQAQNRYIERPVDEAFKWKPLPLPPRPTKINNY